jgi:hydroxypyruvate isomerase
MERRDFLKTGLSSAAAALISTTSAPGQTRTTPPAQAGARNRFKLKYAPHFGMFEAHAGADLVDQLAFAAAEGFTAFEDNGMRGRGVDVQERIAREMARLGLEMGIFVANDNGLEVPILTSGEKDLREAFLKNIRDTVEVAKRVNTKRVTLVVGTASHRLQHGYQTANVIEALKRAAELCEPSGLVLVAEPLNVYRDHPEFFVFSNHEMYALMKAVDSPSVKILFDVYHTQVNEGNIISNIDLTWDEVAYIQTGDHPGRKEPGTGEINYRNVFRHIHQKGYTGIVGMEHGQSKPGKEGERAVIDAYLAADAF